MPWHWGQFRIGQESILREVEKLASRLQSARAHKASEAL